MAWFSRSFSMKEEQRTRSEEDEEEEEEIDSMNLAEIASATGANVKEDFANLRKTFTRQLWGVASFLAPPPPEKSSAAAETGGGGGGVVEDDEAAGSRWAGQQQEGNDGEVRGSSGAASEIESHVGQEYIGLENLALVQADMTSGGAVSGGALTPEDSDPKMTASLRNKNPNVLEEKNDAVPGSSRGVERPKLTGLRSDFAELRGTVATGISRITSVLREVARDDDSDEDGEDEEHVPLVSSRESPRPLSNPAGGEQQGLNSPRLGFDSFLKPLFGNILTRERSSGEPTIEGVEHPPEGEGSERGAIHARESPSKGEPKYRDLESLPSAIASGIDGISKFAANLLHIVGDEEDDDKDDELDDRDLAVGLTEPVVTFARNIAMHPETWLDFPLTEDDADDDFALTNAQKEHIRALEVAAPGLEALKIELCPNYILEGRFWKIYFVLMHSRLSSNQAQMLSSQQVVRARASMLLELQREDLQTDELGPDQDMLDDDKMENDAVEPSQHADEEELGSRLSTPPPPKTPISNPEISSSFEGRSQTEAVGIVDNSMSGNSEETRPIQAETEKGMFSMLQLEDETEVDEWPDEEPSTKQHEIGDSHLNPSNNLDDEDVSFSDLEEDESSDKAAHHANEEISSSTTPKRGSAPAIPLVAKETSSPLTQGDGTPRRSSERGEFNDWFKVDQDDVASAGSSSP